jgi:hypothetical protein
MERKVFQDFAHVLCQKFIEVPSNRDLVNLTVLGDGVLRLAILEGGATHNNFAVEPSPFSVESQAWLQSRLGELNIPKGELQGAVLTVEYTVKLHRKPTLGRLCIDLTLACQASVSASDHEYIATLNGEKSWGLSTV